MPEVPALIVPRLMIEVLLPLPHSPSPITEALPELLPWLLPPLIVIPAPIVSVELLVPMASD